MKDKQPICDSCLSLQKAVGMAISAGGASLGLVPCSYCKKRRLISWYVVSEGEPDVPEGKTGQ